MTTSKPYICLENTIIRLNKIVRITVTGDATKNTVKMLRIFGENQEELYYTYHEDYIKIIWRWFNEESHVLYLREY